MNKALLSTGRDDWETPPDFFEKLDEEFHFTLDACALPETAKCPTYFTPDDDGLTRPWNAPGGCGLLQSAIFAENKGQARSRGLDRKGRGGGIEAGSGRRYADPGTNGHDRISRVHISQGGNPLYKRAAPLSSERRERRRGSVPEYGRRF